jgi:hypothetical protein
MNPDHAQGFCQICAQCGKSFSQPSTFTFHQRTCSKTKKRLGETLAKAKEAWTAKKRRRVTMSQNDSVKPSVGPIAVEMADVLMTVVYGLPFSVLNAAHVLISAHRSAL